jgi:uncharacterized protein (TIGR00375 family)
VFVPAHAWTPHFAVFGSNSGFDSLEEAFGEYTKHIFAIETGLSSDPEMNRLWSSLDGLALISGSDAHSAPRIGREANIFDTELSYDAIWNAVRENDRNKFPATIEFYPHEGRYHYDGHRTCNVVLHPKESHERDNACPVCGKKLTLGVLHRVEALADRAEPKDVEEYHSLIPLQEIISEIEQKGVNTKTVTAAFMNTLDKLGPEYHIMLDKSADDIEEAGGKMLATAVEKVRSGDISINPGYDGLYGEVHVFSNEEREVLERESESDQMQLL